MRLQPVKPFRPKANVRGVHATFTALYLLFGAFFLGAPILFINYEIIFQSGLFGFSLGIGFMMFSITLIGKEICYTRGEFHILARHIWAIVFCAAASIFTLAYYLWNVLNILLLCPTPHKPDVNSTAVFGGESLKSAHYQSLMLIASLDKATDVTSLTEDQAFQLARAAKICRNERGFAMVLLIIIIVTIILNLITIFVYLWLKRKLRRCLPPPQLLQCG